MSHLVEQGTHVSRTQPRVVYSFYLLFSMDSGMIFSRLWVLRHV